MLHLLFVAAMLLLLYALGLVVLETAKSFLKIGSDHTSKRNSTKAEALKTKILGIDKELQDLGHSLLWGLVENNPLYDDAGSYSNYRRRILANSPDNVARVKKEISLKNGYIDYDEAVKDKVETRNRILLEYNQCGGVPFASYAFSNFTETGRQIAAGEVPSYLS